jgi:ribosome-associated toxin RatA of RatAB toxin-antitoxin module
MGTTILSSSVFINRSATDVWNVLQNPGEISSFHPLIKESHMITPQRSGKGARRYCALKPMGVMEEVITRWEEGQIIETEVTGGKMLPPYTFMKGIIELVPISNQECKVTFTFTYELKFGFLGRLMNIIFIRPQFRSAPVLYTNGLKDFVENQDV